MQHLPKFNTVLCLILSLSAFSSAKPIPEYLLKFENLPIERKKQFQKHLIEADRLFKQQRIFEVLDQAHAADLIVSDTPNILTLKGASHIELRDFKKAEIVFKKAIEITPTDYSSYFNLGEVYFVTGQWEKSLEQFSQAQEILKNQDTSPAAQLIEFKLYICHKKLGNQDTVSSYENKYDFHVDSPIFYYINAVKEFEAGNSIIAHTELGRATRVFRNSNILSSWKDTLIEAGYIKSFYGGGDRDQTDLLLESSEQSPTIEADPISE